MQLHLTTAALFLLQGASALGNYILCHESPPDSNIGNTCREQGLLYLCCNTKSMKHRHYKDNYYPNRYVFKYWADQESEPRGCPATLSGGWACVQYE
ncbi:hypothetical protein TUN199_02943 [Pyrenophora tritici-repentis]|uniref:Uncharacterized protein n=1 Tax=Pyrenophora tritici-repentis TaxID=45151 RepID=A0A5M9LBL7_9PLEO|nr:hypothetical protein PtrV1_06667 [Pyrenophora tritici-repentis]KAF7447719.1 hypothetical protein A1F99_070830 [Pyrenophora tritici-repentis]KAF7571410.1 hypothetical protein PtrM4_089100 [Pyrenophora tritici-repentis]KAI0585331.1 hypothetical protein Alg215_02562 [Pyrenophora tritici-repentis]KAI0589439.1 hypothetical protein Alg130_02938 [Pyrenophora tritici-repentis]